MFKHIQLTAENGHQWKTTVNPNVENKSIKEYFLNRHFDVGAYPKEDMQKCIKIEFLFSASFDGKQKGALGLSQQLKTEVFGSDEDEARLKLYNRYEHIQNLHLKIAIY